MNVRLKTAVSVLALFPLAACGGGGGGSGGGISGSAPVTGSSTTATSSTSSTDSSSGSSTPVTMTTSTSSAITTQTATGVPATDPEIVGAGETNTVTITPGTDSTPPTMTFDIHGSGGDYSHTFDLSTAVLDPATKFSTVQEKDPQSGAVQNQLVFQNMSYSTFGAWQVTNDDGSGVSGAFAQGQDTPIANMPKTGGANYQGSTVAQVTSGGTTGTVTGNAALAADFGKGTITGNFTNFVGAKTLSDLTMNANITGSSFAGAVQSTDGALTGNGAGAFRGPQYNEVSGTYAAGGGTTSVVGAFGAKKQ
jgi:hypothetical protein